MFVFSSPFRLKVSSSKSVTADEAPAACDFGPLSGFFHSTVCSAPFRNLERSKSTVIALKKCENRCLASLAVAPSSFFVSESWSI